MIEFLQTRKASLLGYALTPTILLTQVWNHGWQRWAIAFPAALGITLLHNNERIKARGKVHTVLVLLMLLGACQIVWGRVALGTIMMLAAVPLREWALRNPPTEQPEPLDPAKLFERF